MNSAKFKPTSEQNTENIGLMFNRIADSYSFINHILSFGLDFCWRRRLADLPEKEKNLRLLDLATGTGDLLIELLQRNPNITEAVGLDVSEKMLNICRKKIAKHNFNNRISLFEVNAVSCPFSDESFDIVTMGFGIRNMLDTQMVLNEIYRLLRPDGKLLILEFSIPTNKLFKYFYLIYLRHFIPLLGGLLGGSRKTYRYLNTSIENFHSTRDFLELMRKAGFIRTNPIALTFGIVHIYEGRKITT
ncbi:bifunctional demethylmenaquinone methyltransferase/2-methoxy-6-polyprenyl-1,4-benzoquinol methylase UbiE [Planctomycetota bacterium]